MKAAFMLFGLEDIDPQPAVELGLLVIVLKNTLLDRDHTVLVGSLVNIEQNVFNTDNVEVITQDGPAVVESERVHDIHSILVDPVIRDQRHLVSPAYTKEEILLAVGESAQTDLADFGECLLCVPGIEVFDHDPVADVAIVVFFVHTTVRIVVFECD